jgi:hypothetical protein
MFPDDTTRQAKTKKQWQGKSRPKKKHLPAGYCRSNSSHGYCRSNFSLGLEDKDNRKSVMSFYHVFHTKKDNSTG